MTLITIIFVFLVMLFLFARNKFSPPVRRVSSIIVSIIVIAAVIYGILAIYMNMPYTGSVNMCDKATNECKGYEGRVYLDTMDGIYFVDRVYMDTGDIVFQECIAKTPTKDKGECKDTNGREWMVTVMEERGLW